MHLNHKRPCWFADMYFSKPRTNSAHSTVIVDGENDTMPCLSAASNRACDPKVRECFFCTFV